jgi:endonuclease/exonuclease/phosphatase family metal-dependent hydrolase
MQSDPSTYNNLNRIVLAADIQKDGRVFRIATTHLTWTPNGGPNGEQRRDAAALLHVLEGLSEFVLCGDFNAPRGGDIFSMLASRYKDNIPLQYTSSLDPNLHRAGQLGLMVDGIFSTSAYTVSAVKMVSGISDHCALVATVSKTLD